FEFVKQKGIDPISTLGTPGNLANNHVDSLDRWQQNNPNGKLQGFTQAFDFGYYNYIASDAIIVNASFIRMKSLSLNYQLPNSLLRNLKIQNRQMYMNAQNLFTISPYKGFDPQNPITNINLPALTSVHLGLKLTIYKIIIMKRFLI